MLVLTRRPGQSIMVGNDIEIKLVEVKGDQVRIGIVAPAAVTVHRREVFEQIQAENRSAARVSVDAGQLGRMIRPLDSDAKSRASDK